MFLIVSCLDVSLIVWLVVIVGSDDEDLEFYVRECGQILGINKQLEEDKQTAKNVLEYAFSRIVEYKKANQVCVPILEYIVDNQLFFVTGTSGLSLKE